jgi:DNA polymerase III delta prime subunit
MHALLLTGPFGAGKTAVAIEISHQLATRQVRNAALDLDWLAWVGPDVTGDALQKILEQNLAAVVSAYRAAGVERLVLARALLDSSERSTVERALGDIPLTVVRLLVDGEVAGSRVSARDTGSELAELTAAADQVAAAVTEAGVEDLCVDNDGSRSLMAVALEVLDRCGWSTDGPTAARRAY